MYWGNCCKFKFSGKTPSEKDEFIISANSLEIGLAAFFNILIGIPGIPDAFLDQVIL